MSSQISLWTALIGIGATIALVQPNIAIAKNSVEIGETAKAMTVLITEPNSVGSGVILQQQGDIYTVLTAAHVVKNKANYQITTSDDRKYDIISSSIRTSPGNIDLAVVKFKSTTKYPTAKLGNCNLLKSGMDLYVGGFPSTNRAITAAIFVFREGKVSANSDKVLEKGYSLVYSNDTLPGMSGGAVLNGDGELVAIHGRGDRDESGAKTGFNLGIPVNRFATVASKMGVELAEKVAPIPQNTAPKADDYIALAGQKYGKGDYQGELADYNRAISIDPNLAIAYNYRGLLKENKLQDIQGALADYNRAISIDPNYAIAYNNRAALKSEKLQDLRGGLADINRAISIDPNYDIAYNNRGALKAKKLQDVQGALSDYNRAIQLDPNNAGFYNNRGLLKAEKLQDVRGALADYDRAIQLDPNNTNFYNSRGALKAEKLQDVRGALADYDRAIQLDPNNIIAYNNRGLLKKNKLQDLQGALSDYNRAIQINPNFVDIYNNRGALKIEKLQDLQGGLADLNRAISIDPNYVAAYSQRSLLKYDRLNDKSGGIADMQRAAKLYQQQGYTEYYQRAIEKLKQWQ